MRIWQAGKKREALHIPSDPIANAIGNAVMISNRGVFMIAEPPRTTGLYTGIVKMADGREIEYSW